jgi:hypothetical protein
VLISNFIDNTIGDQATTRTAAFYCFSTVAQVWAAILGFGGLVVRDRWRDLNSLLDRRFHYMVKCLRPINFVLAIKTKDYNPNIFYDRDLMVQYLINNDGFKKTLDWDPKTLMDKFYAVGDFGANHSNQYFTPRDADHRIADAAVYFNDFVQARQETETLRSGLHKMIIGGVIIIFGSILLTCISNIFSYCPGCLLFTLVALCVCSIFLWRPLFILFRVPLTIKELPNFHDQEF